MDKVCREKLSAYEVGRVGAVEPGEARSGPKRFYDSLFCSKIKRCRSLLESHGNSAIS